MTRFVILALGALLGSSMTAQAQAPDAPREGSRAVLEKFDANGNGRIDGQERTALRKALMAHQGKRAGKGQLGADGQRAGKGKAGTTGKRGKRAQARRARAGNRYDKNGDGFLSPEEREAAKASFKERQQKVRERSDRNGDGKVGPRERAKAKQHAREKRGGAKRELPEGARGRRAKLRDRTDRDDDGEVSPKERRQTKRALGRRRQSDRPKRRPLRRR